jgi:hypothetical protein
MFCVTLVVKKTHHRTRATITTMLTTLSKARIALVVIPLICLMGFLQTQATAVPAIVLEVRYGDVEIQRGNTSQWFRLPVGAVMPVGEGDSLRTADSGRAHLQVSDMGQILILPVTTLTIDQYNVDTDKPYRLHMTVEGVIVQQLDPELFNYHLNTTDFHLLTASQWSAVWSFEESVDALAVVEGDTQVQMPDDTTFMVNSGQAFWGAIGNTRTVDFSPPFNAAKLEARLFGCDAVVSTPGQNGVNVRRGIGQFNEKLGLIPDEAIVSAMAINEAGFWVRIQYLSGFSWIVEDSLIYDCPNLPRVDDNTRPERIYSVINPLDSEVALLQPFFQTPNEDAFFYLYR